MVSVHIVKVSSGFYRVRTAFGKKFTVAGKLRAVEIANASLRVWAKRRR